MTDTSKTAHLIARRGLVLGLSATTFAGSAAAAGGAVLVVGGSGRTGNLVMRDLMARGLAVRGLARRIDQARADLPDASWFAGDVRQPATLAPAMAGVDTVVYAVGGTREHDPSNDAEALFNRGVVDTIGAAKTAGTRHMVLLSSAGVMRIGKADADPLHAVMVAKKAGEDALKSSGLGYTIVRTYGVWDKTDGELGVLLLQGDRGYAGRLMTARRDIAKVLAECAVNPAASRVSFEIVNVASPDADLWRMDLAKL
ncbi:MAG: NAD(P)H-binding protein, partial [Rhodospirillaceae bacterium]|nr:NAD(P)H-binding protein [Rhodospirillaceae bacterium]